MLEETICWMFKQVYEVGEETGNRVPEQHRTQHSEQFLKILRPEAIEKPQV